MACKKVSEQCSGMFPHCTWKPLIFFSQNLHVYFRGSRTIVLDFISPMQRYYQQEPARIQDPLFHPWQKWIYFRNLTHRTVCVQILSTSNSFAVTSAFYYWNTSNTCYTVTASVDNVDPNCQSIEDTSRTHVYLEVSHSKSTCSLGQRLVMKQVLSPTLLIGRPR